jgi:3'(2'), 5'-bisphosphate nucleotidase
MSYHQELMAALAAADLAGQTLRKLYADFQAIPDAPSSITTDADRRSQDIILSRLRQEFPSDALCAEEDTTTLAGTSRTGPRLWIVDPIDGTRGFARKNGEFSVMVAFVHESAVVVGVVLEPALERLTYAVRGGGCWRRDAGAATPTECHVRSEVDLAAATLTQSRSRSGNPSPQVQALKPARVVETYSAGIKLALVARGEADIYVNDYREFHDWDIAAGQILVEEAGGTVTGLKGETLHYGIPGAWQREGLLASNGWLHDAAVQLLRSV